MNYIADPAALAASRGRMAGLMDEVSTRPTAEGIELLQMAETELAAAPETSAIRSLLSNARRDLSRGQPRLDAALEDVAKAVALYDSELDWRTRAHSALSEPLGRYEADIRDSIGIREQRRMTDAQAKSVASCLSHHRDISLNF